MALLLLAGCVMPGSMTRSNVGFTRVALPIEVGNRVAGWQLSNMRDFSYVRTFEEQTADPRGWIQAVFYIGLARWAQATGDPVYRRVVLDHAQANGWRLGRRPWHADDQAIAQVYLVLARMGEDARLDAVVDGFDAILTAPPVNSLEFVSDENGTSEGTCQRRWCWCDALFMAPPAWAMLSEHTGDPQYREYALKEWFATWNYLYDREAHLFYRDSRFFERRSQYGNKIFWSRGNGWVFAGLALLLETLPQEHASRPQFLSLYREMAAELAELQHPAGFWAPSLLDTAHYPARETSGTALITFGMAWGLNRGLLPKMDYEPIVDRAWRTLVGAVGPDGRLGFVQQVGNAPDEVRATDTQLYGTGAFLLAASEMLP